MAPLFVEQLVTYEASLIIMARSGDKLAGGHNQLVIIAAGRQAVIAGIQAATPLAGRNALIA